MESALSFSFDQHGMHSRFGNCAWQRFVPTQRLSLFVDNFQIMRISEAGDLPRLLPGSGALLCFPLAASVQLQDLHAARMQRFAAPFLVVNRHAVLDILSEVALELVVVSFRPGRLRYFAPASFAELQDRLTPASELWGNERMSTLHERLGLANTPAQRVALLEAFLDTCLPQRCDARLDVLQDCLYLAPDTRIGSLAAEGGWSLRHFERLFTQAYGVTPKYFARVARLQQVARHMALGVQPGVAAAVMEAGFYDQPHFIHELQRLSGLRPKDFVRGLCERPHFYNPQAIPGYRRMLRAALGDARFSSLSQRLGAAAPRNSS